MQGFISIDLKTLPTPSGSWPNGWYMAEIIEAEPSVSKTGNTMLVVQFRLHDDKLGTTTVRDHISDPNGKYANPRAGDFLHMKVQKLILALHDVTPEDFEEFRGENPQAGLDPDQMVGKQILVNLGKQPGRKPDGSDDPSVQFGTLVNPFYAPVSQWEDLVSL